MLRQNIGAVRASVAGFKIYQLQLNRVGKRETLQLLAEGLFVCLFDLVADDEVPVPLVVLVDDILTVGHRLAW